MHKAIITSSTRNESRDIESNEKTKKTKKKNIKKPLTYRKENETLLDCALIHYDHYSFYHNKNVKFTHFNMNFFSGSVMFYNINTFIYVLRMLINHHDLVNMMHDLVFL